MTPCRLVSPSPVPTPWCVQGQAVAGGLPGQAMGNTFNPIDEAGTGGKCRLSSLIPRFLHGLLHESVQGDEVTFLFREEKPTIVIQSHFAKLSWRPPD